MLSAADPTDAEARRRLAASWARVGEVELAEGDLSRAEKSFDQSLSLTLAPGEQDNPVQQRDLAAAHTRLGDLATAAGNLAGARAHHHQALTLTTQLAAVTPDRAALQRDLAATYTRLGDIALSLNPADSLNLYGYALALTSGLARRDPESRTLRRDLSAIHARLGDAVAARADLPTARTHYEQSIALAEQLVRTDPRDAMLARDLATAYARSATALARFHGWPGERGRRNPVIGPLNLPPSQRQPRDAVKTTPLTADVLDLLHKSLDIFDSLQQDNPGNALFAADVIACHGRLGRTYAETGDTPAARRHYREGLALARAQQRQHAGIARFGEYVRAFELELDRLTSTST